jgi:Ion channel
VAYKPFDIALRTGENGMAAPQSTLLISGRRQRSKFFYLFLVQVLLIALFPYLVNPLATALLRFLSVMVFLFAVYAVSDKRGQWITGLVLAVPTGVLSALFAFWPAPQIAVPTLVSSILFLGFTLVSLLRAVLRTETVTPDTICGALSVYLLMALVWGVAYLLLETLQPGAISLDSARHPNHRIDWFDCMFYSFVTLTSLGYGDMVPVTAQSRSLSILEAVSGIMYVAVLVARLVGLYSAPKSDVKS